MFNKPFSFGGRIRRFEYLITIVIGVIAIVVADQVEEDLIALGILIPISWVLLSQGAKRCHDMGISGWHQLIPLFSFVMLLSEGETGANEYGPNPKRTTAPQPTGAKRNKKRKMAK